MKKLLILTILFAGFSFSTLDANAKTNNCLEKSWKFKTAQVKADTFSVDCFSIAEAAEKAAGGNNFKVFSATFDECYSQLH